MNLLVATSPTRSFFCPLRGELGGVAGQLYLTTTTA